MKKTKKYGIICLLIGIFWFSKVCTNLSYLNKRNKTGIYFSCEVRYSVGNLSRQISSGTVHSTSRMSPSPYSSFSMKRPTSKVPNWLDQGLQPASPSQPELSQSYTESWSWETGICSPPVTELLLITLELGTSYLWEKTELTLTLMGPRTTVEMVIPISCVSILERYKLRKQTIK